MKVLLIKMSSMGDIFHTLPAITDLIYRRPDTEIHWVVEDSFKNITAWHPGIKRVIPIALRRWLKERNWKSWHEFLIWKQLLQKVDYDLVIDAQGLVKSAIVARCATSLTVHGYDSSSAREGIARLFYKHSHNIDPAFHAVQRTRLLFGQMFDYTPNPEIRFGLKENFPKIKKDPQKLIFIVGTSWVTKLWSLTEWKSLGKLATNAGYHIEIIWGSDDERSIAAAILTVSPKIITSNQRLSILSVAERLVEASGVVGLDTGFTHLAGALETPTVGLFGPTGPTKVGLIGTHTQNLQLSPALDCMPCHKRQCRLLANGSDETPPCMSQIEPENVWLKLQNKLLYAANNT